MFATLDTTTRSLYLEALGGTVSLSDTVGFIRDLPHKLVEAFEATLQEAIDADLLLHVIDASSPVLQEQRDEVERVLHEIGADSVPQMLVFNKLDRLDALPRELQDWVDGGAGAAVPRVFVSALDGTGLDVLRALIARAASDEGLNPPGQAPSGGLLDLTTDAIETEAQAQDSPQDQPDSVTLPSTPP